MQFFSLRHSVAALSVGVAIALSVPTLGAQQQALTLQQAVEMAQRQGFAAQAAVATLEAARRGDRAFGERLLPQMTLTGTAPNYQKSISPITQPNGSVNYLPITSTVAGLSAAVSQQVPLTGASVQLQTTLQRQDIAAPTFNRRWSSQPFGISVSQPLNRPNEVKWSTRVQNITTDLAERQYIETREGIALATTAAFFDLYTAKVTLANQIANADVNDTLYNLSKVRFEVGKIAENDLLQSELQLLRARAARDAARLALEQKLAAFRLAINVPPNTPIDIVPPTDIPQFDADTGVAVAQALRNKPFVTANELLQVSAQRQEVETRLNGGPGATANVSYGFNATGQAASAAYQNLLLSQGLTLSLSVPIIRWGAHRADEQQAQANVRSVAASTRLTQEQGIQAAHFAALQLTLARTNLIISDKADTVAAKQFEVAYNRYVIGHIGIQDLFIAQGQKDTAVGQYLSDLAGYWMAYYNLRFLTLYDFQTGRPIN